MNSSRIEITVHAELESQRERERGGGGAGERKSSLNSRFILLSSYLAFHVFLSVFTPIVKERRLRKGEYVNNEVGEKIEAPTRIGAGSRARARRHC